MGGTVTVHSTVGAGSTFTLTLPHAEHAVTPRGTRTVSPAARQTA
jgi:hypothetical protein